MGAERKPSSEEGIDVEDEGGASSERAIACPRCGGRFERRVARGNPFLTKKGAMVVCADCGLDCEALKVYRIDEPW
jgi:DNA-directed RNA polymerase subunit RPC12/RpoP